MSARTVSASSRERRQRIGSSIVSETRATCASGTLLPDPVLTGSSPRLSSAPRSAAGARSTTSTSRSASRYWPIGRPLTAAASERDTPAEVTPSARARSWSTSTRMASTLSPQSTLTSRVAGWARTRSATWSAIFFSAAGSSPMTRNWIG